MNPEFIKRMKKLQKELEQKQAELENKEFTVEKQGITVTMKGNFQVLSINIDESLVDPEDKDIIEDLILITMNEIIDLIKEEQEKISPQTPSGLGF
ncbi:YbaB/EbfC family nucleoid-associated protein [Mycoplasma sp. NEAQ87857]|uniref:YbaB/EbfC family nucleoid-associated protein n=1 Tax=Mycoplasma sp. NEAQ87857 TaxID=2683967 RepID=UPI00131918EF|nr:YbaB/EbfC family nucleoid-associated protein [Mycoplasma sp. NEAQ87857]QGZ97895.1 YbaB/EbfC family nucleoid-associated protein [Mycoplasma sp. NEAQ87857]